METDDTFGQLCLYSRTDADETLPKLCCADRKAADEALSNLFDFGVSTDFSLLQLGELESVGQSSDSIVHVPFSVSTSWTSIS